MVRRKELTQCCVGCLEDEVACLCNKLFQTEFRGEKVQKSVKYFMYLAQSKINNESKV